MTNLELASQDVLRTMYQEVCRHHQSISEFRGKLLGLIPVASGAFIGILSTKVEWSKSGALLVAAGITGAVVTVGLYLYEAWQSDMCRHLIQHAGYLERALHLPSGQFRTLRPRTQVRAVYGTRAYTRREDLLAGLERQGRPREEYPEDCQPTPGHVGAEVAGLVVYGAVFASWVAVFGFGVAALWTTAGS